MGSTDPDGNGDLKITDLLAPYNYLKVSACFCSWLTWIQRRVRCLGPEFTTFLHEFPTMHKAFEGGFHCNVVALSGQDLGSLQSATLKLLGLFQHINISTSCTGLKASTSSGVWVQCKCEKAFFCLYETRRHQPATGTALVGAPVLKRQNV